MASRRRKSHLLSIEYYIDCGFLGVSYYLVVVKITKHDTAIDWEELTSWIQRSLDDNTRSMAQAAISDLDKKEKFR